MTENLTTMGILASSTSLPLEGNISESYANAIFSNFSTPSTSTTTVRTTTIDRLTEDPPTDTDVEPENSEHFILIPLAVLLLILALSGLVLAIARNRRRIARMYCRRRSERKYTLEDDSDSPMEHSGDDYDFDDPSECLLKGKLQIDNSYESTQRKELYT